MPFVYGALTPCGAAFQDASTRHQLCNSVTGLVPRQSGPTTPNRQRHQAVPPARFGLFPLRSPLLRESLLLSSPRGTEMFQFPRFPQPALCVQAGVTPFYECRVSPFGHPRIEAWSAAPRGLSQPPTSFFGFRRQGIHRWLFVAWRTKMLVLAMEFSKGLARELSCATGTRGRHGRHRGESKAAAIDRPSPTLPQNGTETPHTSPVPERRETPLRRALPTTVREVARSRITSDRLEILTLNGSGSVSLERR